MRRTLALSALAFALLAAPALAASRPALGGCPVFPRSSHWNERVDRLPLHPRSTAIVSAVGGQRSRATRGSRAAAARAATVT